MRVFITTIIGLLLSFCSNPDANKVYARQQDKRHTELIYKYGKETGEKIFQGLYWIGMTDKMAIDSIGDPRNVNRSVGSWGVHEQWNSLGDN